MNRLQKAVAAVLIGGGAIGAYVGGEKIFGDVAFAKEQQQVETTREQLATVNDLATAFRNVSNVVEPSVVNIQVHKTIKGARPRLPLDDDTLRRFFPQPPRGPNDNNGDENGDPNDEASPGDDLEQVGTGSGVIMEVDGKTAYILTNNHVAGGATEMLVTLSDGRKVKNAKLVGADPKTDLAVVKIEADHLISAKWGDSGQLQKGDWVLAFGSPFGYVGSMTHGIVSALDRQAGILGQYGYEDFIQVDAPINPGNSGGPLVNLHGGVVGINTAIASRSGGFQGIGFAIPSNEAKNIYIALKEKGKVTRGWLGVQISDVTREPKKAKYLGYDKSTGIYVEDALPGSPATGKLQPDDIIVSVNGKEVDNVLKLRNAIASMPPNAEVTMSVYRGGKQQDVTLKLAEQPEDLSTVSRRPGPGFRGDGGAASTTEALGMRLATPDDQLAQKFGLGDNRNGAVVTSVQPRSAAAEAGIRPGDVITQVDRKPVKDARQASSLIAKGDKKKGVLLHVASADGSRSVIVGGDNSDE